MRWFGRRQDGDHGNGNGAGNGHAGNGHAGNGTATLVGTDGMPGSARHGGKGQPGPNGADQPSLLLTYDGWLIGHILHSERRVLDALNSPFLKVVAADGVRELDRDEVLMVVPPPISAPSALRIAKQPIPVSVDVGVGTLHGQIHVLPGVSPWETWQRSTSGFVPVTGAALDFPDGTTETADVVLVSRHAAHSGLLM